MRENELELNQMLDKVARLEKDKADLLRDMDVLKQALRKARDTIVQQEIDLDTMRASLNNLSDIY